MGLYALKNPGYSCLSPFLFESDFEEPDISALYQMVSHWLTTCMHKHAINSRERESDRTSI